MKNIYTSPLALMFILSACGTRINYIGNQYSPTEKVDVFLFPSSVKKHYEIIGKGIYQTEEFTLRSSGEVVQKKAIAKAKNKGADAIIIQDYVVSSPGTIMAQTDSIGKTVTTSGLSVKQQGATGYTILFLKYQE